MIARFFEALLKPVFALAAHLMAQLFLAPFRALFGGQEPRSEDQPEPEPEGEEPPALEDRQAESKPPEAKPPQG